MNSYSIMYRNTEWGFSDSCTCSALPPIYIFLLLSSKPSSLRNLLHSKTVLLYNDSYLKSVLALSYDGIINCLIALIELFIIAIIYYLSHQLSNYSLLLIILSCAMYFSFMLKHEGKMQIIISMFSSSAENVLEDRATNTRYKSIMSKTFLTQKVASLSELSQGNFYLFSQLPEITLTFCDKACDFYCTHIREHY